jgi:hypothetical protein
VADPARVGLPPEDVGVLGDLFGEVSVVADDEDSAAFVDQLSAQLFVSGSLGGLVVDGAVAEEVEVGSVEEIGDGVEVEDGFLGFVREAMVTDGDSVEELAFHVGAEAHQAFVVGGLTGSFWSLPRSPKWQRSKASLAARAMRRCSTSRWRIPAPPSAAS